MRKFFVLLSLLLCITFVASAQEDNPAGTEEGPVEDEGPIDGGIAFLLAAGAAYGLKKARASTQFKKDNCEN